MEGSMPLEDNGFDNNPPQSPDASVQSSKSPTNPQPILNDAARNIDSDVYNDTDSALGDDDALSTTTVGSDFIRSVPENGRTYQAYRLGACPFPNDKEEQNRLDQQHDLVFVCQGDKLFICPDLGEKRHKVLDVGTGTGIWATEYSTTHPNAVVVGIDFSLIQPEEVPLNCFFQVDDAEEDWTFWEKFDFIHCRMLAGSIEDWPRLVEQSFKFLSSGGYMEVADICWQVRCDDNTMPPDSKLRRWSDLIIDSSRADGKPLDQLELRESQFKDAGFQNVVAIQYRLPQNNWPEDQKLRDLGELNYANMIDGIEAISLALLTRYGMNEQDVDSLLGYVREELADTNIHAYFLLYVFYGQKL